MKKRREQEGGGDREKGKGKRKICMKQKLLTKHVIESYK